MEKENSGAGVRRREDFRQVGDSATPAELIGVSGEVAGKITVWAPGTGVGAGPAGEAVE